MGLRKHKEQFFKGGAYEHLSALATPTEGILEQTVPGDPSVSTGCLHGCLIRSTMLTYGPSSTASAECAAPADRLFSVVRRFGNQPGRDIRLIAAFGRLISVCAMDCLDDVLIFCAVGRLAHARR